MILTMTGDPISDCGNLPSLSPQNRIGQGNGRVLVVYHRSNLLCYETRVHVERILLFNDTLYSCF